MRGTVAKRLRRQAIEETKGNHKEERTTYFTGKGEKYLSVDCERGRYRMLKKMYYYAKRFYKKMPKLQVINVEKDNRGNIRLDVPEMRGFLDLSPE